MSELENLRNTVEELKSDMKVMSADVKYMRKDLRELKDSLKDNYVTKDVFAPVKKIAYGMMSLMVVLVVTIFGALISYVSKKA